MDEINNIQEQDFIQYMQKQKEFEINPCEYSVNFDDKERFAMLKLTSEQKMQMNELLQHVPTAMAAGAMSTAYRVSFPKGLPHTLISLHQGGFGSQILDNGKIAGSASFFPMVQQSKILGVFTIMSIVTGQFFLTKINKELHMINKALDDIMKFLYGDKKAELLSERSFVKYACDNYASIMAHELHRTATITSIQEAKKIAMKDIDFYMNDLENKVNSAPKKKFSDLKEKLGEFDQSRENLDFSLQLYLMSSLMEVYYAQNYEMDYIKNLKKDIDGYIKSCNNQVRKIYGKLQGYFDTCSQSVKSEKDEYQNCMNKLEKDSAFDEMYSEICKKIYGMLDASVHGSEYYLKKTDGNNYNLYYKIA